MEYEFRRNTLNGTVLASFSMDHEVLGRWLSQELGDNQGTFDGIIEAIAALRQGKISHWQLEGGDLSLELDAEQARVFANVLEFDADYQLEEDMNLYDAESQAFCGLEDFEQVLHSWRRFLKESR
jgi:uncharacterized protein